MNNLFDIDIEDSSSDKNDPPPDEQYPLEFFLSFNEHNDIRSSSSNSLFFCSLKLIESNVDLRPSFLLMLDLDLFFADLLLLFLVELFYYYYYFYYFLRYYSYYYLK